MTPSSPPPAGQTASVAPPAPSASVPSSALRWSGAPSAGAVSLRIARPRLPGLQVGVGVLLLALMLLAGVGLLGTAGALVWEAGSGAELAGLAGLLIAVRAMGISRAVLRYVERLVSHDATFRLLERIRVWFHGRLVAAGPVAVGRLHSADLLDRVVADVELLQELHLRVIAPAAAAALVSGVVTVALLRVDPWSAAIVLALLAMAGVLLPAGALRAGRAPARRQAKARGALRRGIIEGLGAWREASLFGRGEAIRAEMMREVDALSAVESQDARVLGVDGLLHQLIVGSAALALLVRGGMLVAAGEVSPTVAAAMIFGVLVVFEAVQSLPEAFWHLERSRSALQRLESDVSGVSGVSGVPEASDVSDASGASNASGVPEASDVPDASGVSGVLSLPSEAAKTGAERDPGIGEDGSLLALRDFGVVGEEGARLQGLSFRLARGERLVVTGPSGSGKSTLVRGLVGLERTTGGCWPAESRRRERAAVLPQEVHVMRAPLAENLRVADRDACERTLRAVLEEVGLGPALAAMPDGLDTDLGEEGARLSGGERRRLGLARLLLRVRRVNGPMLLLFDEPSAHLDAAGADLVWSLLDALRAEHAQLVVSHRPLPLASGDRVLMLEKGRPVEHGVAAELLAASGPFAALRAHQEGELRFD